jgi:hypothetical protein
MTTEEINVLRSLKEQGYAVIVWTPEELGDHDADDIEHISISHISEYLLALVY